MEKEEFNRTKYMLKTQKIYVSMGKAISQGKNRTVELKDRQHKK